jgi:hypothetical protein
MKARHLSHSRSGATASRFKIDGTLDAAVAANEPRIDHDPTTIEFQNLLTYSQQFDNAAWTKTRSSISANATVAPDGTTTADKLVEDSTASATHLTFQAASVTNGTSYAWSTYAKAGERSIIRMLSLTAGFAADVYFNLSSGTVSTTVSGTGSIEPVGNGWYRCTVVNTATSSVSVGLALYLVQSGTTSSYTGDGSSGLYIWGAQLNTGATALPYKQTVTQSLTEYARGC